MIGQLTLFDGYHNQASSIAATRTTLETLQEEFSAACDPDSPYERKYTKEVWGNEADIFEERYLKRRLEELDDIFATAGGIIVAKVESETVNE